ncbi:MAG: hypothetical protein HYU25_17970 [Candidatus Rokubacteria bacterium]|nr:hypothetical protein [Candidatus Rokubacteria bacterium]
MKTICAWCEKEGKEAFIGAKEPLADESETHGICGEHRRELEARVIELRKAAQRQREEAERQRREAENLQEVAQRQREAAERQEREAERQQQETEALREKVDP